MGCPYHYDVAETKSSKSPVAAGLLIGALAVGSIAFSFLSKKKGSTEAKESSNIVEVTEQPGEFKNRTFLMPHFTIKNFVITHEDNEMTARVDYKIDEELYNYLQGKSYKLRFTLPTAYQPLFEGNGVQEVEGETSGSKNYSAKFIYQKRNDTDASRVQSITTTSDKYVLDVIDAQGDIVNHFDNVNGAASIIRF